MQEIKFESSIEEVTYFLDIVKEFNKISNTHKLKFLDNKILFYTIQSDENQSINAFKSYILKRGKLFPQISDDTNMEYVIIDGKKFHQKFNFLINNKKGKKTNKDINGTSGTSGLMNMIDEKTINICFNTETETGNVFSFNASDDILELNAVAGDNREIRDFDINMITEKMNPALADGKFSLKNEDLAKILKLAKLDNDNDLIEIDIDNGDVKIGESDWRMSVAKSELEDNNYCFRKEYLKYIEPNPEKDHTIFYMFDSFILINEQKSILLINLDLID